MSEWSIIQIKEMLSKITQGEWTIEGPSKGWQGHILHGGECWDELGTVQDSSNAIFIASAPSIIRQLVGEVERLKYEIKEDSKAYKEQNETYEKQFKELQRLQAEVERLEKENREYSRLCTSASMSGISESVRCKHLQKENKKLKKERDDVLRLYPSFKIDTSDLKPIVDAMISVKIKRLEEQLAKYERVVSAAKNWFDDGESLDEVEEALKQL